MITWHRERQFFYTHAHPRIFEIRCQENDELDLVMPPVSRTISAEEIESKLIHRPMGLRRGVEEFGFATLSEAIRMGIGLIFGMVSMRYLVRTFKINDENSRNPIE